MNNLSSCYLFLFISFSCLFVQPTKTLAEPNPLQTLYLGYVPFEGSIYHQRLTLMIKALKKRSDIGIKIVDLPTNRSLRASNMGIIDGEMARIRSLNQNPEYPNLRIVDAPWMEGTMRAIAKKGSQIQVSGWEDLTKYLVCHHRGVLFVENNIKKHNLNLIKALNKPIQALQMTAKGRCDITAHWYEHFSKDELEFMKAHNLVSLVTLGSLDGFIYLHKSKEHLIPVLQKALYSMAKDGTRDKIFQLPEEQLAAGNNE